MQVDVYRPAYLDGTDATGGGISGRRSRLLVAGVLRPDGGVEQWTNADVDHAVLIDGERLVPAIVRNGVVSAAPGTWRSGGNIAGTIEWGFKQVHDKLA